MEECYSSDTSLADQSYCADRALVKSIKRLRKRIQNVEWQDESGISDEELDVFVTYECKGYIPGLYRHVWELDGSAVSSTKIASFDAEGERDAACLSSLKSKKFEVSKRNFRTECGCSGYLPKLSLSILDIRYQSILRASLITFSRGNSLERSQDCQKAISELDICS